MNIFENPLSARSLALMAALFCFVLFLTPFAIPLLMAALFAFALEPTFAGFLRGRKWRRSEFASLSLTVLILVVVAPFLVLSLRIFGVLHDEGGRQDLKASLAQGLEGFKNSARSILNFLSTEVGVGNVESHMRSAEEFGNKISARILEQVAVWSSEIPVMTFSFLIFIAALYVFIAKASKIRNAAIRLNACPEEQVDQAIEWMQSSCRTALLSAILIGAMQAALMALGCALIGYGDPWIVLALSFLTSFIPIIGVAPISLLLALGAWIGGSGWQSVGFIGLAAVVGTADNIARIYFVGAEEKDLNPVFGLFVLLGAIYFLGLPGLFIGPVVATLGARAFVAIQASASID